jgi:tripartite-type tricarboxylate transporter receptor subunit TctC
MRKPRASTLWLFAGIIACADLPALDSFAQSYPVKPIRMVVGFPVGVGSDTTARMVAQKLPEHLGQPVVVENRTGAAGQLATERVVTSPADGYTLLMMTSAETIRPALRANLPYDLERDLAPVSLVAIAPFLLVVHPSVPAHNVKDVDCACAVTARQTELWLYRCRQHVASCGRAFQIHGQGEHRACGV